MTSFFGQCPGPVIGSTFVRMDNSSNTIYNTSATINEQKQTKTYSYLNKFKQCNNKVRKTINQNGLLYIMKTIKIHTAQLVGVSRVMDGFYGIK